MKRILFLLSILSILILGGCSKVSDDPTITPSPDLLYPEKDSPEQTELSLDKHSPYEFFYDEFSQKFCMIAKKKHTYTLYHLNDDSHWKKSASWHCQKNEKLFSFCPDSKGNLYVIRQKGKKQYISQCKKQGSIKNTSLPCFSNLEHISISGNILSANQKNTASFYQLYECSGIGAAKISTLESINAFTDIFFYALDYMPKGNSLCLITYDYRLGEPIQKFALNASHGKPQYLHLCSTRDHVYLLTAKGLFGCEKAGTVFHKKAALSDMKIDKIEQVVFLYVGKNQIFLGISDSKGKDSSAITHLYCYPLPAGDSLGTIVQI